MTDDRQDTTRLRVESLRQKGDTPFTLSPDADERAMLAKELGATSIRKLRFDGRLEPRGRAGWTLRAQLGATVVQPCIVTLEPVSTRIDTEVVRRFVPPEQLDREEGTEIEMDEDDDTLEPLGPVIDLAEIMSEALALSMPAYPRKDGVTVEEAQFAAEGIEPLKDDDVKPFAGLKALRDKLQDDGGEE